jgi:hypothetical protein
VKLAKVTLFAAGYVIGTRAGRERYAQIVEGIAKTSARLEEFSSRRPPTDRHSHGSSRPDSGS